MASRGQILVSVDGVHYWFETEAEAENFYRQASCEREITVYDQEGKPAYGCTGDAQPAGGARGGVKE